MEKDKKIVLEGVLQRFDTKNTPSRTYPSQSLLQAIERFNRVVGSDGIDTAEGFYDKNKNDLRVAPAFLLRVIKLRTKKILKDYC